MRAYHIYDNTQSHFTACQFVVVFGASAPHTHHQYRAYLSTAYFYVCFCFDNISIEYMRSMWLCMCAWVSECLCIGSPVFTINVQLWYCICMRIAALWRNNTTAKMYSIQHYYVMLFWRFFFRYDFWKSLSTCAGTPQNLEMRKNIFSFLNLCHRRKKPKKKRYELYL